MGDTHPLFATSPYKALVIGATGAIGQAFLEAFQADPDCTNVEAISRNADTGFDLLIPDSLHAQASLSNQSGPYEIIIDATGALNIDGVGPEKSLNSLQADLLMQSMRINAIGPAMVLRHFAPLLAKGASVYAKLSARVGSIEDNKKGGWYGYRASKAALNMLLQTAAIELQRKNPNMRVVALQPGTVRSKLSSPHVNAQSQLLEPQESVLGMLSTLRALPAKSGAYFVDYKGVQIPW